jgi:thiol peroxidase
LTLLGPELQLGQKAPDFTVRRDLTPDSEYTLATDRGKTRILNIVQSLDTTVCDQQGRRFNEEAANLGDDVVIVTISMDLPPAQARWCEAEGIDKIITASDYYDHSFGLAYGLRIEELGLLARRVIILDPDDIVRYIQVVPELTDLPNFDAVLVAAREVMSQ